MANEKRSAFEEAMGMRHAALAVKQADVGAIKRMLSSVDWRQIATRQDVQNAAVGSALGGLLLGGASLREKKDPDESRLAPVGDALLGAVLGGAAGYGVPKGLKLFADSGALAKDKLPTSLLDRYIKPAAKWGIGTAGATAASITPALLKARDRLKATAGETFKLRATELAGDLTTAQKDLYRLFKEKAAPRVLNAAKQEYINAKARLAAFTDTGSGSYAAFKRVLKERLTPELRDKDPQKVLRIEKAIKVLETERKAANRGYHGIRDLVNEVPHAPVPKPLPDNAGVIRSLWRWLSEKNRTRYAPKGDGRGRVISPGQLMRRRITRNGLLGILFSLGVNHYFPDSAIDNSAN